MKQTLHVVGKDVRRLRWVLATWILVLAARVALAITAAPPAADSLDAELFLREVGNAFGTAELLLMALIVARLVHEEPLVGFNAFWLTRPYRTQALVLAKFIFAGVVLVALPVAGTLLMMIYFGAGPAALVSAGAAELTGQLTSVLPLMVIAVLTPSLGAFVLTIVGLIAGVSILFTTVAGLSTFWGDKAPGYTRPGAPDATPGVVMLLVFLAGALAVVLYQYRRRRRGRAVALAVAVLVAACVVPAVWPWSFARAEEVRPDAIAERAVAAHDPSWGTEVADLARFGRSRPRRQVNARIALSSVPADTMVESVGVRSRLRFSDGTAIDSSQLGGFFPRDRAPVFESALGGVTLLVPLDPVSPGPWSPMVTMTEEEFVQRRGQSGRLDATIDFNLTRTREVGVLPLTVGAVLDRELSRFEIVGVQPRADSRGIVLRSWRAQAPFSPAARTQQEYVLRNRARAEALPAGIENTWSIGGRGNAIVSLLRLPFAAMGYGVSVSMSDGPGFSPAMQFLRFPPRGFGKPPQIDPSWFDDAELVVLETTPAGTVTRALVIDDFGVPMQ